MAFPTTPILDNFNRADGPVGSNWTTVTGLSTPTIVSNQVASPSSFAAAYWNPTTFASPLEIHATIPVWSHQFDLGYCLTNPGTPATTSGYVFTGFGGQGAMLLLRYDNGVSTNLGGFIGDPVSGDRFGIRLVGGVHTLFKNGNAMVSIADSTYTSGNFSLTIGNTTDRFDDYGGGPFTISPGPFTLFGPSLLLNTANTLYIVPSRQQVKIRHIHVQNTSASPATVTIAVGSDAASTRLYDAYSIPARGQLNYRRWIPLVAGDSIQAYSGTDGVLNIRIDGFLSVV
jgi:hypothetical protein